MGYKRKKQTYKLVFDDPEFEGLIVHARKPSVGEYAEITEIAARENKSLADLRTMLVAFAGMLSDWNLEDDADRPVPITPDALIDLDADFVMEIIGAWMLAVEGIAAPLEHGSTSGETTLEASMPMEVLSPALLS
jgi:hypothetical protein